MTTLLALGLGYLALVRLALAACGAAGRADAAIEAMFATAPARDEEAA